MSFEVKIPSIGESINEVTVGQWMKQDGDYVELDDVICEIESEKATLEIRAEKDGVLKIVEEEGATVPIGHKIAEIDTEAEKPEGEEEIPEEEERQEEKEAEEEKAKREKGKGQKEKGKEEKEEKEAEEEKEIETEKKKEPSKGREVKISPVASRLLTESGLKAGDVKGTGPGGRITKSDVAMAMESHEKAPDKEKTEEREKEKAAASREVPSAQRTDSERKERRSRMSTLRKTIARRMVEAKNQTAMLTTFNELDMSKIMEVRKSYKDLFQKKYDLKLGFMSFFVRACCIALREFPEVNARIDEDEIVYHDYCDISIAVSTPKGLVVPVIFDADRMSLAQIETEVDRLATRARDNKLTIEEMTGGTFSITNGGVFGSLLSTPIINVPQTAILGMHKIEERPIAIGGEVVIRPMMYVALSYDHRLIDGKESVSFLVRLKELLEDPARMLLEV